MTNNRLILLITRKLSGELSTDETSELEEWANKGLLNRSLLDSITDEEKLQKEVRQWLSIDPVIGYNNWLFHIKDRERHQLFKLFRWSAAAAVLAIILTIGIKKYSSKTISLNPYTLNHDQLVLPGRNVATLVLGNGQQLLLDSAENGPLVMQGQTKLVKQDSGSLSYQASNIVRDEPLTFNTLTTPRSGQYHLTLSDGSQVWLNNVSSLRYPTYFKGTDRTVELSGEAYFEIAKDAAKPFLVKVKGETVKVLGTSFNVMAYPEENNIQTTLLTGAVQVKIAKDSVRLRPDEQARLNGSGDLDIIKDVSAQDIVSWKNGFFYFGRASLQEVMRQIARWYDVEVVYEGKTPELEFGGKIDRTIPLNDLLKFLDKNEVHFRLEGRKLVVRS